MESGIAEARVGLPAESSSEPHLSDSGQDVREPVDSSHDAALGSSLQPKTEREDAEDNTAASSIRQPANTLSKLETAVLMTTLCLAVFLAALDVTIVTTALPSIADHFHSTEGYTWVGSSFLLAAAVIAPSWGKFSDIWGRKSILLIAIAIFLLGSALCGAAVNLSMLLAGRTIQGLAAGGMFSLVNIVVGDLFSQRDRSKYYGIVGMVWACAFTLGPLIGGAFTRGVSWRWCFLINLPISGVTFFVIALLLKLRTPKTPLVAGVKAIDWIGSMALIGGLLMLLLGLQFGGTTYPWGSAPVICLLVFGVLTILLFILVERRFARYPIVPVHLYRDMSNLAILAVNLFHGIVFTENIYFLPLYCQSTLGADPLLSGLMLLPFAVSISVGTVATGIYVKKTGRYLDCIRLGFIVLVLGAGLQYDLPATRYWPKIVLYQILPGLGIGLNFQPPLIALQSAVSAQDNGAATASFGLVRNVASAIGVIVGSAVFSNQMNAQQTDLVNALGVETAREFTGSNAEANIAILSSLDATQQAVVGRAFWVSLRGIWIVSASMAGAALMIGMLIRHNKLKRTHEEVETGLAGEERRRRIVMQQRARKQ